MDFTNARFDNFRLSTDAAASAAFLGYQVWNPWSDAEDRAKALADRTFAMNYSGRGLPRKEVDTISAIWDAGQLKPRQRQNALPRAFIGGPFMGPGVGVAPSDVDTSSRMEFSGWTREPRSVGTISGRRSDWGIAPLTVEKAADLRNPRHYIQELARPGWERGGTLSQLSHHETKAHGAKAKLI